MVKRKGMARRTFMNLHRNVTKTLTKPKMSKHMSGRKYKLAQTSKCSCQICRGTIYTGWSWWNACLSLQWVRSGGDNAIIPPRRSQHTTLARFQQQRLPHLPWIVHDCLTPVIEPAACKTPGFFACFPECVREMHTKYAAFIAEQAHVESVEQ